MMDTVVDGLVEHGWVVLPDFLSLAQCRELREQALVNQAAGAFHAAGIGRGQGLNVNELIRGDQVLWLEQAETGALADYQAFIDSLRVSLNQALYLGLVEFEAHFAVYPPGARYQQHLDNFRGTSARIISAVLYLNEAWDEADGGQLRLYTGEDTAGEYVDIFPHAGQLALFRSEVFWHEVRPATRERFSLTGWLRRRGEVV
ncbi:SM-20-related protein [Thiothrix caldifontis]|uniref:SM-20-related protein n=1 Tax=Thiothrix caldifontis TaxID=525918 RepID=A0A1H4E5K2_9GAMM|nr:2OG-Fe(II) oxygenase [Thiothrix caldifontis]SEA80334.1 SM-20-related protein [Thiothrix caldifontis]